MDNFKYSWTHDEKFGWTLVEEDFSASETDQAMTFAPNKNESEYISTVNEGDDNYFLYKNRPAKITAVKSGNTSFSIQLHSRESPHTWDLPSESDNPPIEVLLEEDNLTTFMRIKLNLIFQTTTRQCTSYIHLNYNLRNNLRRIKAGLKDFFPVTLQLFHNSTNISQGTKKKIFPINIKKQEHSNLCYFKNSKFSQDMELDCLILTRQDVLKVKLYKTVRMSPQSFINNSVNTVESGITLVGFGFFGAWRNINGTGIAKCVMGIFNGRTNEKQKVNVVIERNEFDVFSFWLDRPMVLEKGDSVMFNPEDVEGDLNAIDSNAQEFCGEDGT
jgi:hypothetical protein